MMDSHGIREYQYVFGHIPMKSLVISSMPSWKLPELGGRLENPLLLGDFRASHGADFPLRAIFRLAVKISFIQSHIPLMNIIKYEISQTIRGDIPINIHIPMEICIFWWL